MAFESASTYSLNFSSSLTRSMILLTLTSPRFSAAFLWSKISSPCLPLLRTLSLTLESMSACYFDGAPVLVVVAVGVAVLVVVGSSAFAIGVVLMPIVVASAAESASFAVFKCMDLSFLSWAVLPNICKTML